MVNGRRERPLAMAQLSSNNNVKCAACGREIDQSPSIRKYQPLACWHPELRKLGGLICSHCKNWDFDTFDRYDRSNDNSTGSSSRRPLRLKDGKFLTSNGGCFRSDITAFFLQQQQ
jgi:hypothetical protein